MNITQLEYAKVLVEKIEIKCKKISLMDIKTEQNFHW